MQHDAERIPEGLPGAGGILVFSNGLPKTRPHSTVEQIRPTMVEGRYVENGDGTFAAEVTRVFPKPGSDRFFAAIVSGAQRLPNGNTLMAHGPHGRIVEVNSRGMVVWQFENPHGADGGPTQSGAGEPILPGWISAPCATRWTIPGSHACRAGNPRVPER